MPQRVDIGRPSIAVKPIDVSTLLPSSITAAAAPTSPRFSKFSANASFTRVNLGSQVPSIFTAMNILLVSRSTLDIPRNPNTHQIPFSERLSCSLRPYAARFWLIE